MPRRAPEDQVVHRKRTFWQWFKGWPLRVVIALAAFYLLAIVITVLDQHVYWFHMLF